MLLFWGQVARSRKEGHESYQTGKQTVSGDLLSTVSTLNLTQNITPVKNQFWSAHICWGNCAGKGHSFLQIMLTRWLLQAVHEDDIVSWPVDTFLVAQLFWVFPGWNPKASKISSRLLWFVMEWNLPLSHCNCKKEVNQLENSMNTRIISCITSKCHSTRYTNKWTWKIQSNWRQIQDWILSGFNF